MNKHEFIEQLAKQTNRSKEDCIIISNILEDNFFISRKHKKKIINQIIEKLNVTEDEADNLYNNAIFIIAKEIKNQLKHPFRSKD